jgi:iron complex outermembrane receptor protein
MKHCKMGELMKATLRRTQVAATSGLVLFLMTMPALYAQEASEKGLDEIVVTATRKEEPLDRVPISVVALTQQAMDEANVRNISDIQQLAPGLQFSPQAGAAGTSTISIRGVSSGIGASTTGIYIDDTPIQIRNTGNGASNPFPLVFDLERVEVLRGPQGTLFGAGAEGGAVRFITPQPSLDTWKAYARSELSFTDNGESNYEFGAAAGGPIVRDELGFRISAWYRQDGGYIDQVNPDSGQLVAKNTNSKQSSAVKLDLTWKPLDNLTVTPSVYFQDYNSANRNDFFLNLSDPEKTEYRNGFAIAEPNEDTYELMSLRAQYDFSGASLVSNSSFFHRANNSTNDYTNLVDYLIGGVAGPVIPNQVNNAYQLTRQNSVSQEIRLQSSNPDARLNWVTGFFFSNSRRTTRQYNYDPNFDSAIETMTAGVPGCAPNGCDSSGLFGQPLLDGNSLFRFYNLDEDKQFAGFGQIDFRIVGGLKLTAGVRYSHLDYTFVNTGAGPFYGPAGTSTGKHSESPVTPKYGLSYQFDSALVYASASKGFRPGGSQNAGLSSVCAPDLAVLGLTAAPDQYKSDSLWSYELGTKLQFLDNRLHIDASVFRIYWKNIQQIVDLPICGGGFIDNIGSATNTGFDLAIEYKPDDHFLFGGATGYTNARLTKTIEINGVALSQNGDPVQGAGAPWSANINAEYHRPISGYESFLRLDERYQSRWRTPDPSIYGYDPGYPALPEQKQLNAKAGMRFNSAEISLFATNVTNAHSLLALNHDAAGSPVYYGIAQTPRIIGIMGTYRY